MSAILVIAHAPLASSLAAVAAHAYPECGAQLRALDIGPGVGGEQAAALVQQAVAACGDGEVLLLVDVYGATPCNAALKAADGVRVRVVAGVNVPMLWRTLCYGDRTLDDLVERAIDGGAKGVMHVPVERPRLNQSTSLASAPHDQDAHHHQQ